MDYYELIKLFPDVKIPVREDADYYIDLLIAGGVIDAKLIDDFADFTEDVGNVSVYKKEKLTEIATYLKKDWDVSTKQIVDTDYTLLEFGDFRENYIYISFDLTSANWSAWKEINGKLLLGSWDDFVTTEFGLHPVLAKSKSFRQFVFGNTYPTRLQSKQKEIMGRFLKTIPSNLLQYMVSRRPDEIIFQVSIKDFPQLYPQFKELLTIPENFGRFHNDIFRIIRQESAGETVAVRENLFVHPDKSLNQRLGIINRELFQIDGNRFFIHFKNVILQEPIEERDLMYKHGKFLAKWIL
jgi:hypothetical protein